jgi:hypothetical protein
VKDQSNKGNLLGQTFAKLLVRFLDVGLETELLESFEVLPDSHSFRKQKGLTGIEFRTSPFEVVFQSTRDEKILIEDYSEDSS